LPAGGATTSSVGTAVYASDRGDCLVGAVVS